MPNPIAHPAASIPFTKAGMVFSALIIGSIAPDFGYFIPLPTAYFMYTAAGLFLFDVPVGLILLWLFHVLVKWPLLSLLPEGLQRRLFKAAQGFSFGPLRRFGLVLLSLLVGSLTHVVWDSFTHDYGWMVGHFAFFSISIRGIPLYTILQELGTILGVGILLYWFIRWLPTAQQGNQLPAQFSGVIRAIFLALTAVSIALVEAAVIYLHFTIGSRFMHRHFLIESMIVSAAFVISFFAGIYCLAWMIVFYKTIRVRFISVETTVPKVLKDG
jgi:hypothetical protein